MPNLKQRGIKILGRCRRRACRYRDNQEPRASQAMDAIPIDLAFPGENSSQAGMAGSKPMVEGEAHCGST